MPSDSDSEEISGLASDHSSEDNSDSEDEVPSRLVKRVRQGREKPSKEKPKAKSKTRMNLKNLREYVDEEAESDSEGDDAGTGGPIAKEYLEPRKHDWKRNYDKDADEILEEIKQREKERQQAQRAIQETTIYPTLSDPKLFRVRVKSGFEREACVRVLRKYFDLLGKPGAFSIFSCSSLDKLGGHIFIEAMRSGDVRLAVEGLNDVNADSIRQVKLAEIPQIFAPDPSRDITVTPFSFARIVGGLYEGDLAMILGDEEDGKVLVKLVPRLSPLDSREKTRPPPKLFNPEQHPSAQMSGNNMSKPRYLLKREVFEDGFLLKKFALKALKMNISAPSFEEYNIFVSREDEETKEKILKTLVEQTQRRRKFEKNLSRGERVIVMNGDYIGSRGTVVDIEGPSVVVKLDDSASGETIAFTPAEVGKLFEPGERVEVTEGKHKGVRGVVDRVQGGRVFLISDNKKEQIEVDLSELREALREETLTPKLVKASETLRMYDLVHQAGSKRIGAVIRIGANEVTLLDAEGISHSIAKSEVGDRVHPGHAKNSRDQDIRAHVSVRVRKGPHHDVKAQVRHVYGRTAWLLAPDLPPGQNFFVEDVDNCDQLQAFEYDKTRWNGRFNNPQQNPNLGQNLTSFNPQAYKESLIGQKKKILKGEFKGYEGIVRSIVNERVMIELSAKNKTVNIPLNCLNIAFENTTPNVRKPSQSPFNPNHLATPGYDPEFRY